MRVVIDTNVLIGAFLFRNSKSRRAYDLALERGKVLLSFPTFDELADVLYREKLDKYIIDEERSRLIEDYVNIAELTLVNTKLMDCRDPKDDKFLELAVDGKANCIVTGDKDLLVLNPYRGVLILTPEDFLLQFGQS